MEFLSVFGALWLLEAALPSAISLFVIVHWRARVQWRRWEYIDFVLPFAMWALLDFFSGKSMSNIMEGYIVGFAVLFAVILRASLGTRIRQPMAGRVMLIALCVVAAAVHFLVPGLPE